MECTTGTVSGENRSADWFISLLPLTCSPDMTACQHSQATAHQLLGSIVIQCIRCLTVSPLIDFSCLTVSARVWGPYCVGQCAVDINAMKLFQFDSH